MTDPWIDSGRGGVAAWEVDHVGHFTVAYYHQRIEDAGFAALEALGLGPAYARSEGRDCLTTDCYVRYLHELRGGDIYHVRSGVLAIEEEALVFGHRLFESASGALCTTVEQRVAQVDVRTDEPIALAAAQRRAAEAHRVDSGGHLMAAFGMTPAYMRVEQRGLSTFEFQLSVVGPLRSGDLVRVQSALVHVGKSSLRLFHRMTNARTGGPVATLEQSGVHLDREARRSVPLPEALRSKAVAMLALTVE